MSSSQPRILLCHVLSQTTQQQRCTYMHNYFNPKIIGRKHPTWVGSIYTICSDIYVQGHMLIGGTHSIVTPEEVPGYYTLAKLHVRFLVNLFVHMYFQTSLYAWLVQMCLSLIWMYVLIMAKVPSPGCLILLCIYVEAK